MATEYIEKQAALKAVCDACGITPDREKENCQYKFAGCKEYYNVFGLPPADVRPVVRGRWIDKPLEDVRSVILCKDCVMYRRDKELAEASYLDPNYYCGLLQSEMPEDGFCSYGKRRRGD